jgi:hypothetical protein
MSPRLTPERALISAAGEFPGKRQEKIGRLVGSERAAMAARYLSPKGWMWHVRREHRQLFRQNPVLAEQESRLSGFANTHRGERCVIIGNGPSLRKTDMSLLEDQVTFGLNRVYLAFDEWGFDTTYHVVVNKFVAEQSGDELSRVRSPLFTTLGNAKHLVGGPNPPLLLLNHRRPGFYGDVRYGIWEGATVTFVAMQLAYYMGFSEVILVGVDHRFKTTGPAHKLVESTSEDPNHFDPRYFGPGYKWQLPDLETSEIAYGLAREAFERDGRRIVDATVDGALDIFPRAELSGLLR